MAHWNGLVAAILLSAAGLLVQEWGWWVAALAVPGVAALVLDAVTKRRLTAEAASYKVVMHDCLQPIAHCLVEVANKTTAHRAQQSLPDAQWASLTAALGVVGSDARARASIFIREGSDILKPSPTLSTGRGDHPVSTFHRGHGEGVAVWKAAEANEVTFYRDLGKEAPSAMDTTRERTYRTFITAPLRVRGRVEGLLTINSSRAGDLTVDDKGIMRVIATTLSVAMTLAQSAKSENDTKDRRRGGSQR